MINTVQIKQAQLKRGYLTLGSGATTILVMGSCRVCNYVSYLDEWNRLNGDRFTIHTLDPFNFNWNENDERVDYEEALLLWEKDERLLAMIKEVDWFIHEFYQNSGIFNVNKDAGKSIYDFGMKPKLGICLPNLNDCFILSADIVNFDAEVRKKVLQDMNVLGKVSKDTTEFIQSASGGGILKFVTNCMKSDVPEMGKFFLQKHFDKRLYWSYNHTTELFTRTVFNFINEKFLHLDLKNFPTEFEDIFRHGINTPLTDFDVDNLGYSWDEPIVELRSKL